MYKVERAIIMAAGFGSRMSPLTLETPKPLVKVNGTRMIDTVIRGLHENGIYEIYVVVGYLKEQFYSLRQLVALYWVNVELLGGLMYPIQLFGMDFELCQQGLALLALVPIWLYRGRKGYHSKPFQYACYAFYPVHMLLLVLVLNFVNR